MWPASPGCLWPPTKILLCGGYFPSLVGVLESLWVTAGGWHPLSQARSVLLWPVTAESSSDFPIQQGVGGALEPRECQSPRTWLRRHMLGAHTKTVQTSEQPCPRSLHVLCGFQARVFDIQGQGWVVSRAGLLPISQMGCLRLAWVVQRRICGFLTLC